MTQPHPARAAGLDLVRTLAIALVLAHHFRSLPGVPDAFRVFAMRGYVGVDLFFVLSGWLIGGQLWRELRDTKTLEIGRFWRRRWLRTLPSYLAILVVLFGVGRIAAEEVPMMALFLQNYAAPEAWLATWSLCIEEHFYLVLPLIALALRPLGRARVAALALLVLLAPVLRFVAFPSLAQGSYDDFLGHFYGRTHLRFDGLALGVGLAALATWRHAAWEFLEKHRPFALAAGIVLVGSHWLSTGSTSDWHDRLGFHAAVTDFFVVALGVALVLPWARSWRAPRPLAKALQITADHAYALYLTHELARDGVVRLLAGRELPYGVWLAAALGASVVAAAVLRQVVEKPGLAWRERRQAGPSAASPPARAAAEEALARPLREP